MRKRNIDKIIEQFVHDSYIEVEKINSRHKKYTDEKFALQTMGLIIPTRNFKKFNTKDNTVKESFVKFWLNYLHVAETEAASYKVKKHDTQIVKPNELQNEFYRYIMSDGGKWQLTNNYLGHEHLLFFINASGLAKYITKYFSEEDDLLLYTYHYPMHSHTRALIRMVSLRDYIQDAMTGGDSTVIAYRDDFKPLDALGNIQY